MAVKELIEKSPNLNVNEKDCYGNLAAIVAAERNDFAMLKFLVEKGANLELKDGRGRTVEGWAEKHQNKDMLRFIEISKYSSPSIKAGKHS